MRPKKRIVFPKVFIAILILTIFPIYLQAQFVLSAEIRPRTEYRDGFKNPRNAEDDAVYFTEQRSRLNFDFADSAFTFRISLQDIRIWGENNQIFKQEDGNTFLSEAWFNYKVCSSFSIKGGRQIISYDNQRYLGGLEWAQQGRRHDAVVLKYHHLKSKSNLDFGLAFNADDDVAEPLLIQAPRANFYRPDNYKFMQYAWYNISRSKVSVSVLAINLGYQTNSDEVTFRQTLGTHGEFKPSALSLGWDFYYQLGKSGPSKVNAYLAGAHISYKTKLTPIKLGVEFLSGKDDTDASTDIRHFQPDFGTNHAHNGYMDYFFVGPSNGTVGLLDVYFKNKFDVKKGYISVHAHQFFTGSEQFGADSVLLSMKYGTELDLLYDIQLHNFVKLQLGYSIMFASEAMLEIRGKDKMINHWSFLMFTVNPELFNSGKNK